MPGFQPKLKPSKPQALPAAHHIEMSSQVGTASEYARMLADPLNAMPVGRPDSNSMATNVARIRDVFDITTNASQVAAFGVAADTVSGHSLPVITGANVVFTTGATQPASQYHAQLVSDNNAMRVLCYVVEWQPTQSVNNMSGKVYMGQYPVTQPQGLPDGAASTYFDDEGLTGSATLPMTTIARPWMENIFLPLTGAQENVPAVCFVITGATASTVVGQIVVTRIVELLPKGAVLARMQATHTVCDPMACCQGANIVGRKVTFASGAKASDTLAANGLKLLAVIARTYKAVSSGGVSELAKFLV